MRPLRALLLLALGLAAAGCGDADLWARWRAERMVWHAQALEHRLLAGRRSVGSRALSRVEARWRAVLEAFPASRWASPPATAGAARQTALAAGLAALHWAAIPVRDGREAEAAARFAQVDREWSALPGIALAAELGLEAALRREGRYDEALALEGRIADRDPLEDPDRVGPEPEVLAMPVRLAAELRERGRGAAADSELARADQRFASAAAHLATPEVPALAEALGAVRVARRDGPGALAALRLALRTAPPGELPLRLLALASAAVEAGVPDSAIGYARWARAIDTSRRGAGAALLAEAQAWEALGQPDSAMACDDAIFDRWNDPTFLGPPARFQRARLLSRQGQWVPAQAELQALAAAYPTDSLAFESYRLIVQHDLDAGAPELARVVGDNAIENLDLLVLQNRDSQVQRRALAVRADILLATGRLAAAESSLVDLWRRFPEDSSAQAAGLAAGRIEEHVPGGQARAESLYAELAARASRAAIRREARARLQQRPAR